MFGFHGDRDEGLTMLHESFKAQTVGSPISCITLLVYYVNIAPHIGDERPSNGVQAEELLQWSLEKYPKGFLFHYMKSRWLRSQRELQQAIEVMKEGRSFLPPDLVAFEKLSDYQEAWCHFLVMEWKQAATCFQRILEEDRTLKEKSNFNVSES